MLCEKRRFHQITNAGDILGETRPGFILPGTILVEKTFQPFGFLVQAGITFSRDPQLGLRQFFERIERSEETTAPFLKKNQKFFLGDNLI